MILYREEERIAAERRKKRLLTAYIIAVCLYAAAALALLFLSPDHYTLWLIADILLTVAFGFGSVYFFTISYDTARKRSRLLDKIDAALTDRVYGVFLREEDQMTIDGVEMRILLFKVCGDEREYHVFENDIPFVIGEKYLLLVRGGVIAETERVDE